MADQGHAGQRAMAACGYCPDQKNHGSDELHVMVVSLALLASSPNLENGNAISVIYQKGLRNINGKKIGGPANAICILRCSICTGEQVAGFKDIRTGKFEDVMPVRADRELGEFRERYGISEINREY